MAYFPMKVTEDTEGLDSLLCAMEGTLPVVVSLLPFSRRLELLVNVSMQRALSM